MKLTKQQNIITRNLQAQLNGVQVLPICLYGEPGLGKSSIITQVAKNLNAAENVISISSTNFEFYSGIPTFSIDTGLDQYSTSGATNVQATIWSVPELISSTNRLAEKNPNGVVLHLEDYHTMDKTTENVMYQLLLDRRLGDYKLHPKVAIIASMNHSKESGGGHFNSAAVKSRLSLMPYTFNFQHWYDTFGAGLHPWLSSFIKTNDQYIIETESKTLDPSGSARSYSKLSLDFDLYTEDELVDVYLDLARGKVSSNAVNALEKHVIYYRKLDFAKVVKNKTIPNLADMTELDKVLWGYIFHSIVTPADALYNIDLINKLMDQPHYDSIIGFISGEMYAKYIQQHSGKDITPGQAIVISKLLSTYDPAKFDIPKTLTKKLDEANFTKLTELASKIAAYM